MSKAHCSRKLAITTRRVIAKFGFISRRTVELNINKVESIQVDQSVMGAAVTRCAQQGAGSASCPGKWMRMRHSGSAPRPAPPFRRPRPGRILDYGTLVISGAGTPQAWDEEHTLGARLRDGKLLELCGSVLAP